MCLLLMWMSFHALQCGQLRSRYYRLLGLKLLSASSTYSHDQKVFDLNLPPSSDQGTQPSKLQCRHRHSDSMNAWCSAILHKVIFDTLEKWQKVFKDSLVVTVSSILKSHRNAKIDFAADEEHEKLRVETWAELQSAGASGFTHHSRFNGQSSQSEQLDPRNLHPDNRNITSNNSSHHSES